MKTIITWLKRAAMLSVTVAFAAAGLGANAATGLTLNDGDTLTGVYEDYEITIAAGATVTFNGATITHTSTTAPAVNCLGDATIILAPGSVNAVTNTVRGYSCVRPAENATLTIRGSGTLMAAGGDNAAAIGSGNGGTCGSIVIGGGTIEALGGTTGAGIGSGNSGTCGSIVIDGGTVTAQGGDWSAGIGSAYYGTCGDITISGGIVTANVDRSTSDSSTCTAAIGAGCRGTCGNILISGGTVVVDAHSGYSRDDACAIGATYTDSRCGDITLTTGITSLTATKGATAQQHIGQGDGSATVGRIYGMLRFDAEYSNDDNTVMLTPKASFESYTVTWKNDDGTTADTTSVEYGLLPSHAGLTKAGDGTLEYLFAGWTPEFAEVESNVAYTAVFCAVPAVRSTGGDAEWFMDAGEGALRSGAIEGNQNTWLQTTLSRPCVLSFKWKTSSEPNWDTLVFYVDGVEHSRISGESADWANVSLSVEDSKNHVLRWVYSKDGGGNGKYDCGWIRDFVVTPYDSWAVTRDLNYEGATELETRYVKKGRQLDVSEFPPLDEPREGYTCYWALAPWSGDALSAPVDISADTTLYARWIKQHGFDEIDTTCQTPWTWLDDGSIRTGKIGDGGETWATISVTGPCDVSFKWKSSSEDRWDKLHFYVDTDHKTDICGVQDDWATFSVSVDSGEHVLKWTYTKDGSGAIGEDCGWVKDIVITEPESAPYTVTWKNVDGTTLETDADLEAGAVPVYNSALPTLAATAQYTYEFAGWEPEFELVSSNTTYTAKYTATLRSYDVTWQNEDGTSLGATNIFYGATPTYSGATPTKAATPKYTYTFAGWDPEVATVTGEATYTAKYDATINEYTITWKNDDGTVIDSADVAYDETPTHADPTKASTAQYHYEFAGWDPEVASVTGEAAYTATFTPILRSYTITWLNEDGTALDTSTVEYGAMPSHAAPTKASTAQYDYTFAGWGNVVAVSGEATYQATFTPVLRSYTVSWVVEGETVASGLVAYGTTPAYGGATPTKAETAEYTYTFSGWSPAVASVTGPATYTAQFNATKRSYTITWANIDGEGASTTSTFEYGTTPVYGGATPVKASTAEYSYEFAGWSPAIASVSGEATYTAQFNSTKRSYAITWANIDGEGASTTSTFEYGATPAYSGATPTKAETAEYTYTFAGWSPVVVSVTGAATYTAQFEATSKEPEDEFAGYVKISDVEDFNAIANNLATNYVLMADIDLQNVERQPFGTFSGVLDGNGHAIRNLNIKRNDSKCALFSYLNGATIRNLTLQDGKIEIEGNNSDAAGIAGCVQNGALIEDCTVDGLEIISKNLTAGGFVGYAESGNLIISRCRSLALITANGSDSAVGGFVGYTDANVQIEDCYYSGVITAGRYAGGIVGQKYYGTIAISNCYHNSCLYPDTNNDRKLVGNGDNQATITGNPTVIDAFHTGGVRVKVCGAGTGTASYDTTTGEIVAMPAAGSFYAGYIGMIPEGEFNDVTVWAVFGKEIATVGEFNAITNNLAGVYKLTADIDLQNVERQPFGEFSGVFDGNGHAVRNIRITKGSDTNIGLFSLLNGATIRNLTLDGGRIEGYDNVGGIAGKILGDTLIEDSSVNIVVFGNRYTIGGFVGYADGGNVTFRRCCSFADVTSVSGESGGLVGATNSDNLRFEDCYAEGMLVARNQAYCGGSTGYSGGLVGLKDNSGSLTISNCYHRATMVDNGFNDRQLVGNGDDKATITGVPSADADLTSGVPFEGWDTTVWKFTEGLYPRLRVFIPQYTVTWLDEDGVTVLDEAQVDEFDTPVYGGVTPTKAETAEYTYTFAGWSPAVDTVTGAATYTATFNATPKTPELPEGVVDLSTLTGNYTAQNGDTLTGATGYEITIAVGATVTLDGVIITHTSGSGRAAIDCAGNATIVLAEGSENFVSNTVDNCAAIHPANNATLTIRGSGSLDAYSSGRYGAGIGSASTSSGSQPYPCGNIVIEGGTITATGGWAAAGVGAAAWSSPCGDITITSNAVVNATGGTWAAGVGAASDSSPCGDITISGNASVTANSTPYSIATYSAGIGAADYSQCGSIVISTTGTVEAHGVSAAGIGAANASCSGITITSGTIMATGGSEACAIGASIQASCGDILISGGTITATGGANGPGVGTLGETDSITITGGNVTSIGGSNSSRQNGGAGIGSSYQRTCGDITISGGTVTATGGAWSAGIGSGYYGTCGDITISGGTVTANVCTSTDDKATDTPAIGAGCRGTCGDILISGGTVVADATNPQSASDDYNSAIGATYIGTCGDITITDGITSVTATKGASATATHIGKGYSYGTVTVGTVTISPRLAQSLSNNDLTLTLTPLDVPETVTVTWKNEDGTTLATDTVAYGTTPAYGGETPTKAEEAQYTYTFDGWIPAVVAATSNTTYTATFSSALNEYVISWDTDGNGEVDDTTTVAYGTVPTHADGSKAATAQYTYTFTGWDTAPVAVTGPATYTATFSETVNEYEISWVVEGVTVASGAVAYGTRPTYTGETPTKESTAEYSYAFSGWSPTISAVTGEATYTAQFEATKRSYMVSWVVEGMTVASGMVEYGQTPSYGGDTPTKESTAEYTYTFMGWSPTVAAVTGAATYTAQFSQTKRSYTVSWVVAGATVASGAVEYGQTPTYGGDTPTKESTAEYSYAFTGWSPAVAAVTGDATYTAQFSQTKRSYTVSWVVDGMTVASGAVEYGQTPTYDGDTPTKASTAEYSYEFTGWSPTVVSVTDDATYTAQFSQTKRSYTITWVVEGATVASGSVEYGTIPVYNGATPTKPEDENYTYTFSGWTPAIAAVTGNATYTATFTATPKEPDDPDEPYEGTETINGITWSYTAANGEATITDADGASGNIVIPDAVHEGVPVTAIASGVLADNRDITSVTIGRNVRRIGEDVGVKADDWEQNLEEVGFDGSYPAFGNCESLMDYKVDPSNEVFEEIGGALYYRNTPANAKELALYPSGRSTLYFADGLTVTKIGDGACAWCHQFTELTIPASVREIGVRSFDFCREIVTLTISATVTDIGWGAFLMNIALENADINGTDLAIGEYAFYHSFMADNAGNLVIRGGVKDVGFNAFCNSMHLGSVVIEDGVTNIAMNAFSQCYDLSTVTLPDTLTAIGAGAFCGCSELREIIVPLSVDEIGLSQQDDGSDGGAFAGCSALARIYLPLSLKPATAEETNAYLANVFNGLGLEDMSAEEIAEILTWYSDPSEIGGDEPEEPYDGTETIDGVTWSFSVSNGVATITDMSPVIGDVVIPATVTNGVPVTALKDYIENLRYDDGITSITLPASVTNIGAGNFVGCTALGAINVAEGNASYSSADGILYNAGQTELLVSPGGKTVVTNMPESVVEIASGAFECSRVQFCVMAQYATNIAERAFSGCSYLGSVSIEKHIRNIGAYAFENCGNIRVVNFASDSECEVIGVGAFSGCEKLQKVTIPDSVIVIRGGAFSGCPELFDVTIGSGVAQIGDATVPHYIDEWGDDATMDFDPAFGNCANLRDFKVSKDNAIYEAIDGCIYYRSTPNTAKTLAVYPSGRGDLHFYGGVTVTAIGEGACSCCNKLKKLTIPQSVKDIGIEAFAHCEGVTNVYIQANSVTNISFGAFAWNMNTMDVQVSGSVKTIGEWAFMHNFGPYNLNDDFTTGQLVLHEGIREIGRGAFERCFRIGEIEIPRSVQRMGESAFADTRLARRIVIGNGLRVIPESAFKCDLGGSKLSELIIGNNVVGIGACAFSGCEKLRNLNIPSAVWDIGDNAFSGCTSLCALNLPSNLKSIGAGAFGGSSYSMMMSSARSLLGIGAQTFDGCTDLRRVLVPNSVTNIGVGAFGAVTSENLDRIYLPSSLKSADDSDTLAFLADQFPGLNLGIGDVTWYDDESELNYVTVTFDPNNGGETWSEQVLDYLDALPVPVTNGYAFAGWWTTSDDSGEKITMSRHFSTDTTLYAHWIETSVTFGEDAPWTAVYDDYYGEWVLQSGDVAFGHTSSASMTVTGPCIVGFDFMNCMDEWGTSNDLMILVDGEEVDCRGIFDWTERTVEIAEVGEHVVTWSYVNLNGSFNDYARLRNFSATPAVAHTVTFNLEGGTMAEATSRQVLRSLGALPIPVKAGYIFNGWWWTDGDGFAERVSTDFAVEDDVELVARWEKSPFSAVGGDASWFLDENGDYRTEAIGKAATVWAELRFKGPANISFDYKASMSWMSDDHFEFVVDGERALYQGGISSWRSHSEAFSDDAEHVVRWVVRRNDYGEEDYEAENCAWLTRLNLPEAITAAETPPVEVDDTKMEEPVDNGDGTRTIAAKEGETLTQSDVASVTVASPVDPAIDITAAYTKTLVDNTIVLQLAVPALEDVPELNDDDEDPSGMLDDVDDIDDGKIAAMPEPDVSDPDPEKREEVGALPIKMYPGLYYQASWGDDLNNLTSGAKFRADGSQTHIGVIKQTGRSGFYRISVSER